jgi:hypothetical protein
MAIAQLSGRCSLRDIIKYISAQAHRLYHLDSVKLARTNLSHIDDSKHYELYKALFRKYCPQWPSQGFKSVIAARKWVGLFVNWYNEEHRHSQIRFVTPGERHRGEDKEILAKRDRVYAQARERNPSRWSGETRNWTPVDTVALNPDRSSEKKIEAA